MEFVGAVIFAAVGILLVWLTDKYYMPVLVKRISQETKENVSEGEGEVTLSPSLNLSGIIWIYVMVAAFCAASGFLLVQRQVGVRNLACGLISLAVLSCVAVTDLKLMIIPNLLSVILLGARVVMIGFDYIEAPETIVPHLIVSVITAVFGLIFLLVMSKVTKGGIGAGDVKILSSLGFLCGLYAFVYGLLFSLISCAVVSSILLISKKKKMKDTLPFGPFIFIGFSIAVILGVA